MLKHKIWEEVTSKSGLFCQKSLLFQQWCGQIVVKPLFAYYVTKKAMYDAF